MNDKSVLVIDTPKSCGECPLKDLEEKWMCNLTDEIVSVDCEKPRPKSCPLRPLPIKAEVPKKHRANGIYSQAVGWNKCIDKVTGETE